MRTRQGSALADTIVDRGEGTPIVVVPGIQGRWEYIVPAVEALSARFRVVTFPLDRGARDGPTGVDAEVERVKATLDACGIERAVVSGISYGGAVATSFAATHGARTAALVVASAPGVGWHLRPRHRFYARLPRLFGPLFLLEVPFRLRPELVASFPDAAERRKFVRWQIQTLRRAPFSTARMAERALSLAAHDIAADCRRVTAPTLVITGEGQWDRVVPVESTATYARWIPDARSVVLERTGHLGAITRPWAFADEVEAFIRETGAGSRTAAAPRREAS